MTIETLKINLAQRILSISNKAILEKMKDLLDRENVFAYDVNGHPVTEHDYIKDLKTINTEIDTQIADLRTTSDVLKPIADENKLAL